MSSTLREITSYRLLLREAILKSEPVDTHECVGIDETRLNQDEPEIVVPKILLSICSRYFRALFRNWGNPTEVRVPGVSSDILKSVAEYACTGETLINDDNVEDLTKCANQLMIDGLLDQCQNYLIGAMDYENCIGFYKFGSAYFCRKLASEALSFILRNFEEVSENSDEILELSLEEVENILRNDYLNVEKEEVVWNAIRRWTGHDRSTRVAHTPLLLQTIRLGLLSEDYIRDRIIKHPDVSSNPLCEPVISEALRFLHDIDDLENIDRVVTTPPCAIPRISDNLLFAVGGWSGGEPTDVIEVYDHRAERWTEVPNRDPLGPRAYHGCVVVGHEIFVIGGFNGQRYFRSCRCFNVVTRTWREIAPMNCKRCYVNVALLDGFIYAFGGNDGRRRLNSAERYDFTRNQWSYVSPMHFRRSDACAATLNGLLFIVGGFDGQTCLDTVEYYDPVRDQWSLVAPMSSLRSAAACVSFRDGLYVVGGYDRFNRLRTGEMFNPTSNTWAPIPEMTSPRSNFGIEVIDDKIFVVGGFNGTTTILTVEYLNINSGEWSDATDMNFNRSALDVCLVSQVPNVRDYCYPHRDQLAEERRRELIRRRNPFRRLNTVDEEDDSDAEEVPMD